MIASLAWRKQKHLHSHRHISILPSLFQVLSSLWLLVIIQKLICCFLCCRYLAKPPRLTSKPFVIPYQFSLRRSESKSGSQLSFPHFMQYSSGPLCAGAHLCSQPHFWVNSSGVISAFWLLFVPCFGISLDISFCSPADKQMSGGGKLLPLLN